ncbi:hypothetical protein CR513_30707, partial [Mucuna pruriens]
MAPNCSRLQNFSKTESEGFKDYAQHSHPLSMTKRLRRKRVQERRKGETNAIIIDLSKSYSQGGSPGSPQIMLSQPGMVVLTDSPNQNRAEATGSSNAQNARPTRLRRKRMMTVVPMKLMEPPYSRSYDPNAKCDYHVGVVGHSTERCWALKHKVQDLIEGG